MSDLTDTAKAAAGQAAANLVESGMVVGLGTGSTAAHFIKSLSMRCREGLQITAVATSKRSHAQANQCRIPLIDINSLTFIDLVVDGADEIDPQMRMIKGGGGALLREKIVAAMAQEMVVVIDEGKQVERLGNVPLPIEIVPFGYRATLDHLEQLGYVGTLRLDTEGEPYITDNGNTIADIPFRTPPTEPEEDHKRIRAIPGVVETGFFFDLAHRVIIGHPDGTCDEKSRES